MDNILELSLGKNYVSDWKLWEAIRELLQNAQDAEKEGHPMRIDYDNDDYTLTIKTTGKSLDVSSLVLGNSVKGTDNAIGKYGEGYKLALLVLLRLGKSVKIYTTNETWIPKFVYSETYKTDVLAIERLQQDDSTQDEYIIFEIGPINMSELHELQIKSLRMHDDLRALSSKRVDCEYGQILLDERFASRFYVEGLYIQTDENFKYGYSFNADVVDLDRDRRAINYYDLCELTTKSLMTQTEDFEIVETSITKKTHDSKDLQYFYNQASSEFKEGFADHYIEKHNHSKDTFFGTEKEVAISNAEEKVVVDEITASWLNDGLGKSEEYEDIKYKAKAKNNKEVAYKLYNDSVLRPLYDWLLHNKKRLSKTQILKFIELTDKVSVSGIMNIRDEIVAEVLKECGIEK